MTKVRSAIADWVTIFTGLSTIISGFLAVSLNDIEPDSNIWNIYLKHAICMTVTLLSFYFFIDQSLRLSRKLAYSNDSVLPQWLVYIFCFIGGLLLFFVIQIVMQSYLFNQIENVYFILPSIIWIIMIVVLLISYADKH